MNSFAFNKAAAAKSAQNVGPRTLHEHLCTWGKESGIKHTKMIQNVDVSKTGKQLIGSLLWLLLLEGPGKPLSSLRGVNL